jgi:hypothetical protein
MYNDKKCIIINKMYNDYSKQDGFAQNKHGVADKKRRREWEWEFRNRETETETDRQNQTDKNRNRQKQTETNRQKQTDSQTGPERRRDRDRETERGAHIPDGSASDCAAGMPRRAKICSRR